MGCLHESIGKSESGDDWYGCWDCGMRLVPLNEVLATLEAKAADRERSAGLCYLVAADFLANAYDED